jgi:hypothetical protein
MGHIVPHLLNFALVGGEQGLLFGKILVGLLQMVGNAFVVGEKAFQFLME